MFTSRVSYGTVLREAKKKIGHELIYLNNKFHYLSKNKIAMKQMKSSSALPHHTHEKKKKTQIFQKQKIKRKQIHNLSLKHTHFKSQKPK